MKVLLPAMMESFECRRSLVCCRPPWRVWVSDSETDGICRLLSQTTASQREPVQSETLFETLGTGRRLMAQVDNRCAALVEDPPACALQQLGDLTSLPHQCRNFPRSVVLMPTGVEVGFYWDCPTVCGLIVDNPQPFRWARLPLDTWLYPPTARHPGQVRWTAQQTRDLVSIQTLRQAWWSALESSVATRDSGRSVLNRVAAMVLNPENPEENSGAELDVLQLTLSGPDAWLVGAFLARLPVRGSTYSSVHDAVLNELQKDRDVDELVALAQIHRAVWTCAAGLLIQHVGIHEPSPVVEGVSAVASHIATVLRVVCALDKATDLSTRNLIQDALTASAHFFRFRSQSTMEFVD